VTTDPDALRDRIAGHFLPNAPERLAVAVSGGSDSLGLLVVLNDWRLAGGPALHAVTVDHRLRPEAAQEAAKVAADCERLGVPHDILKWTEWDGRGNLPDQARRARYGLLAEWARGQGIACIAIAHTADDQAETFLMRLARGAGVDGLSAMSERFESHGVTFCRPALAVFRHELRAALEGRGMTWVEDPSNEDPRYERVKARAALRELAPLGITAAGLGAVAHRMSDVRQTLYLYALEAARQHVRIQSGDLIVDRSGFDGLPRETARRLLQTSLKWISGAEYVPRGRALDDLLEAIAEGRDMTLQGCLVTLRNDHLRITREWKAVASERCKVTDLWDGRWRLEGPDIAGAELRALGKNGLSHCVGRRETGLPAASLIAGPSVWRGDELLAAPLAGLENGWRAILIRDEEAYFTSFLSH
jgi:tRNA(Ile)-lysidine synthase